jgi:hypothetical protein
LTTLHPPHPFRHHLAPNGTAARYPVALAGSSGGASAGAGIVGPGVAGSRRRLAENSEEH